MKAAGVSGAFLSANYHGLSALAAPTPSPCFFHTGHRYAPFIDTFLSQIKPGNDSYPTEKYAADLELCLGLWSASLRASPTDLRSIEACLPHALPATLFSNATRTPLRTEAPLESEVVSFADARIVEQPVFIESLRSYLSAFRRLKVAEFQVGELQIVSPSPLQIRTAIHYDLSGSTGDDQSEERTGAWKIDWVHQSESKWSIVAWTATEEQRARLSGSGFVDVTESCLGSSVSYQQQIKHGVDYWRTVLDGSTGIDIYGNSGIAAGDFDGDGWDDCYVCQPAGLPNRLYRNRGDGTFEDVTEKAGVGVLDGTSSAIFADLNNNGHQDLIVVRTSGPLLFVNKGDGSFQLKPDAFHFAHEPQGTFTGIAVADYDRDGLLDVYFCLYSFYQGLSEYQYPNPYYDAQNGPPNFLLRNRGNHTFDDVTSSSGMDQSNNRFSFACTWNDYNKDGWPDLYVVNDFGRKVLYRNNRDGTFTDVSAATGTEDPGEGMSMAWLDYDGDGSEDLYVVNMWEAAGKRVTSQPHFLRSAPDKVRQIYQQDAMGNTMFHNEQATFREVTDKSGTRFGGWNWGCDAWDFDQDGSPDLYVANGFISGPEEQNLSSFFWRQVVSRSFAGEVGSRDYADAWSAINEFVRSGYSWSGRQRNNFYLNNGNGTFTEAAGILGLDFLDDSRAFALADIDQDGRLEILLKNRTSPQLRILRNSLALSTSSIVFLLRGTKSNRDAIGATVELEQASSRRRSSTLRAGSGFLSQHAKALTFGLKSTASSIRATVHWPNGLSQVFENLPANHRIHIEEGLDSYRAETFHHSSPHASVDQVLANDQPPLAISAWLADPIRPPDFKLPDASGATRSLTDGLGHLQVLVLSSAGCPESDQFVEAISRCYSKWTQRGVMLLILQLPNTAAGTATSAVPSLSDRSLIPTLIADQTTADIYDIFHRYLFEQRRDMVLPTTLLLDAEAAVVKIYSGAADCAQMEKDMRSIPAGAEARMQRALPFGGSYFGEGMHHNYFTYGVAFLQYGFEDQAISSFELSIARNPAYGPAYYNLGLIYLNKSMPNQALTQLEKAVLVDPKNADAWNNLGVVYGQKGDYSRAEECFNETLGLHPAHLLAIQNLVKLYAYQHQPERAQRVLEGALSVDPGSADLHIGLAMLYMGPGDLPHARAQFEEAVRLRPQSVEALNGLGVVLMRQGEAAAAMERFKECTQLAPDFDRAFLNMASLYLDQGEVRRAHDVLATFLASHPDNPDVQSALKEVGESK